MKKNAILAIGTITVTLLTGCASDMYISKAGPVVTNVSMDGNGNLIVEKNTIHYNQMNGRISLEGNPTTQTFQAPAK